MVYGPTNGPTNQKLSDISMGWLNSRAHDLAIDMLILKLAYYFIIMRTHRWPYGPCLDVSASLYKGDEEGAMKRKEQ